jgi:hypothetical protein
MLANMNLVTKISTRKGMVALVIICFASLLLFCTPSTSHATAVVGFNPGNIMDNSVMTSSGTMNAAQIQTFLNSKVPVCDTWHAGFYGSSGTWYGPPFTCLKDYTENNLTAAQIIYNAAQTYNINPQVLLVVLQKEESLITDTWPAPYQYKSATGYGCPDSTPGVCNSSYYGFTNQINNAAKLFHSVVTSSPTWYSPYVLGNNNILWSPNASCGSSVVNIQNLATASLYDYTPYRPNQASLNAGYGSGDSCSSHGNRNFYLYFTDWFGSTYSSVYNGFDYSAVYNSSYYLNNNPDLKTAYSNNASAALAHFVIYGMKEGRQASDSFNVTSYRDRYQDLRKAFGTNLPAYYLHYINYGKAEGRIATGNVTISYITDYNGIDYSAVYDFSTYISKNSDVNAAFSNDDAGAIEHFVTYGMDEGRQASDSFNVVSYKNLYPDLRMAFGNNLKAYYMHYITLGKNEGRTATGDVFNGISAQNGIDYSAVYNYGTYIANYTDMKTYFGNNDDVDALVHFITSGMNEGRQASASFNVQVYKSNYADLRAAFGNNLKAYYMHYIMYGKNEGRTAI